MALACSSPVDLRGTDERKRLQEGTPSYLLLWIEPAEWLSANQKSGSFVMFISYHPHFSFHEPPAATFLFPVTGRGGLLSLQLWI
jgi:hypothetical protein